MRELTAPTLRFGRRVCSCSHPRASACTTGPTPGSLREFDASAAPLAPLSLWRILGNRGGELSGKALLRYDAAVRLHVSARGHRGAKIRARRVPRHACQTQRCVACMHALVHACMPSACMHHMHAGIIPSYDPDGTTTCMHAFAVAFACEYRVHVFKTSGCMPSCHACMHVIGAAFPVPRSAVQCIRPYVRFPLAFSSPCLRCLSRQTSAGFMSYVHWPNALA